MFSCSRRFSVHAQSAKMLFFAVSKIGPSMVLHRQRCPHTHTSTQAHVLITSSATQRESPKHTSTMCCGGNAAPAFAVLPSSFAYERERPQMISVNEDVTQRNRRSKRRHKLSSSIISAEADTQQLCGWKKEGGKERERKRGLERERERNKWVHRGWRICYYSSSVKNHQQTQCVF